MSRRTNSVKKSINKFDIPSHHENCKNARTDSVELTTTTLNTTDTFDWRKVSEVQADLKMSGVGCGIALLETSLRERRHHHATASLSFHDSNDNDREDNYISHQIRNEGMGSSLQAQSLRVLAKFLPLYVESNGVDAIHAIMSTMPSSTLSALSEQSSRLNSMNEHVAHVVGHHEQVVRLRIIMTRQDDGTKQRLDLSTVLHPSLVRLELGNLHLEKQDFYAILKLPNLSHLSMRNCSMDDDKDAFITSSSIVPASLQALDLPCNDWVTEEWLLKLLEALKYQLLYVNVSGCKKISQFMLLRLNFYFRGCPLISVKKRESITGTEYLASYA
jgi:hypothetical protein